MKEKIHINMYKPHPPLNDLKGKNLEVEHYIFSAEQKQVKEEQENLEMKK